MGESKLAAEARTMMRNKDWMPASLAIKMADALDATEPAEEWGTMPYGVFGPRATVKTSQAEAEKDADMGFRLTPVVRDVVVIGGRTFATEWRRTKTPKQTAAGVVFP